MRKLIAALLMTATLTTPALAQRDAGEARQQRQIAREGMRAAFGGGQNDRAARREFRQERREFRQERREDRGAFRQDRRDDRQDFRRERLQDRRDFRDGDATRREFRRDRAEDRREFRRDRWDDRRDFRRDRLEDRREWRQDRREWRRDRWNDDRWSRDWRRDPRYNWQDWRQRNRFIYNPGRYYAPRGWAFGYRRFSFGVQLGAPLFAQSYWINDPWAYRLPPAYGPYRWVRYYDDVLMVDLRNGVVVDVIHDFFW